METKTKKQVLNKQKFCLFIFHGLLAKQVAGNIGHYTQYIPYLVCSIISKLIHTYFEGKILNFALSYLILRSIADLRSSVTQLNKLPCMLSLLIQEIYQLFGNPNGTDDVLCTHVLRRQRRFGVHITVFMNSFKNQEKL